MEEQQCSAATATSHGASQDRITDRQKRAALRLVSTCHTLNHLHYAITSVIYPVIMQELDFASEELTDAPFSIYYFVGFVSGPIWTLIIGYVMDQYGFTPAFYIVAGTYLIGMLLLTFIKE